MVQITLRVSGTDIGAQETKTVARYYYTQLERVNNSLTRGGSPESGEGRTTVNSVKPAQSHTPQVDSLQAQRDELLRRPRKRHRRHRGQEYMSDHSSLEESDGSEDNNELIPWTRAEFDKDYDEEDRKFIRTYNSQLSYWN